jgi:hypothetical protein
MARKNNTSETLKAYNKERARISRQIKRMEQRGYLLPENVLPPRPKRITKSSVARLAKIKTPDLYTKSRYIDQETGEILTGESGRKLERSTAAKRAAQTRKTGVKQRPINKPTASTKIPTNQQSDSVDYNIQIFTIFQMEMTQIYGRNEKLFNYITRWYNRSMQKYGPDDFAEALEKAKSKGQWPGWEGVSDEEILTGKLHGILDLIGASEGGREEAIEAMEADEEFMDVDNYEF